MNKKPLNVPTSRGGKALKHETLAMLEVTRQTTHHKQLMEATNQGPPPHHQRNQNLAMLALPVPRNLHVISSTKHSSSTPSLAKILTKRLR